MTLKEIAQSIGLSCESEITIIGLNTLTNSNEFELTFLENKKYINDLENTKAAAVLVTQENASKVPSGTVALICEEPYLNLAKSVNYLLQMLLKWMEKNRLLVLEQK